MKPKEFARLVARDKYCLHCGIDEAVSPNHRKNRGMGGKNSAAEVPANYVLICSWLNERIEGSAYFRDEALANGWKIESWQDPLTVPVFDACTGEWFLLDNDFGRVLTDEGVEDATR